MTYLSIIVPVYNSANKGLERCIVSILEQDYTDFELILVNDGSTDSSLDICRRFANEDNRVKVLDQQNCGVSSARNNGLQIALGEFVTFIDSDDIIGIDYIANLMSHAGKSDLVVCGVVQHFENRRDKTYTPPLGLYEVDDAEHFHQLIKSRLVFGPCNKIFKRHLIVKYNIHFPTGLDYGEDRIFCFDYLKHIGSFEGIDSTHYDYMIQNGDSLSTKDRPNLFELEYNQWKKLISLYSYHNCLTEAVRKDLYVELFWMVNDAIVNLNKNNLSCKKNILAIISIPEIDDVKQYTSEIQTNIIVKSIIFNRIWWLIMFYNLFLRVCKK